MLMCQYLMVADSWAIADSMEIIPSHGGFTDKVDYQMIMAVVVNIYCQYVMVQDVCWDYLAGKLGSPYLYAKQSSPAAAVQHHKEI